MYIGDGFDSKILAHQIYNQLLEEKKAATQLD